MKMLFLVLVLSSAILSAPSLAVADSMYYPDEQLIRGVGMAVGAPVTVPGILLEKAVGSELDVSGHVANLVGHIALSPVTVTVNTVLAVGKVLGGVLGTLTGW